MNTIHAMDLGQQRFGLHSPAAMTTNDYPNRGEESSRLLMVLD